MLLSLTGFLCHVLLLLLLQPFFSLTVFYIATTREGGGPIQEFHDEVYGVDLYANFFMSLCGIPIDPPRSETPKISYGFYFVNCPYTGTLLKNDFLEEARKHPLVTSVECMCIMRSLHRAPSTCLRISRLFSYIYPLLVLTDYCKEGDKVKGLDTQVPDWYGGQRVACRVVALSKGRYEEFIRCVQLLEPLACCQRSPISHICDSIA